MLGAMHADVNKTEMVLILMESVNKLGAVSGLAPVFVNKVLWENAMPICLRSSLPTLATVAELNPQPTKARMFILWPFVVKVLIPMLTFA